MPTDSQITPSVWVDPGQDDGAIEEACDDLRMALQDLASNGPNDDDYERVRSHLLSIGDLAASLNFAP